MTCIPSRSGTSAMQGSKEGSVICSCRACELRLYYLVPALVYPGLSEKQTLLISSIRESLFCGESPCWSPISYRAGPQYHKDPSTLHLHSGHCQLGQRRSRRLSTRSQRDLLDSSPASSFARCSIHVRHTIILCGIADRVLFMYKNTL